MSFILDALKKSETERQQQGSSEFASVPTSSDEPGTPRWLWVLGGLLAINLAVLLGVLLRNDLPAASAVATAPVAASPAAAAPGAAATPGATAEPAMQLTAGASFAEKLEQARERRPAPVGSAEPASSAAAQMPEPVSEPATAVAAPDPRLSLRALPTAGELIANGTIRLPELHLDIHVYSDSPADRFVFINMVRHREGSRLAEGPLVKEITPEGVILDYSGTEFLLPRE